MSWKTTEKLFQELLVEQEKKLLRVAQRIVPNITYDDLLQPNDFPELENHPVFRYEEGVCEGLRTAYVALRSADSDLKR